MTYALEGRRGGLRELATSRYVRESQTRSKSSASFSSFLSLRAHTAPRGRDKGASYEPMRQRKPNEIPK
jgi:hypothetical protein